VISGTPELFVNNRTTKACRPRHIVVLATHIQRRDD
jgi:hypothetical protein